MKRTEGELDLAFANTIQTSREFRSWVLNQTKFRDLSSDVILLHEEQGKNRPVWWQYWWCQVPELDEQRETDIFLVFECKTSGERFSLHIENKKGSGKFLDGQPEGYEPRARFMLNTEKYLSYSDFETVLIAPSVFRENNRDKCDLFGVYISYEAIAAFIPEFRD